MQVIITDAEFAPVVRAAMQDPESGSQESRLTVTRVICTDTIASTVSGGSATSELSTVSAVLPSFGASMLCSSYERDVVAHPVAHVSSEAGSQSQEQAELAAFERQRSTAGRLALDPESGFHM